MVGAGSWGRILIVDDDAELATMLARAAEEAGFEVALAGDGEAALAEIAARRPDCVLLDVVMPGVDGRDVLRRLRADPSTRDVPVIILSARGEHLDRLLGLELGADDYVEKPFHLEMLLRKVGYNIRKRRSEPT